MCAKDKISICYILGEEEFLIDKSDENIEILFEEAEENEKEKTISLKIRNISSEKLFLKDVVMWQAEDLSQLKIGDGPVEVFRSGRHKNDMPGTFTLGVADERLQDVLGAMSETGDKTDAGSATNRLISDHLTVFTGRECSLLITFAGGRKHLFETELYLDSEYQFAEVKAKAIFNVYLEPEACAECETLSLVWTKNPLEEIEHFAKAKTELYGSRVGKRPAVFCTWYYYGLTVTYEDVKTNLQIMQEKGLPFDVFQVDEGWEITLGEWESNEKFPVPMKQVADEIKEAGFRPGIWTSPFIAHETATIWKVHPEWMLKDKEGKPCLFPMNDTIYCVLDITNPATCQYFTELYRKLTYDWGYTYHKLDFTRAAIIYEEADFYDKTVTLAQAYYRAVAAIREGMGEDSYFLMCGGLYDPIVGLVDAQRTGSDVLSMWSSTINKNGKAAPYTIKQSLFRYYMNNWWHNDPDALMIRKNEIPERGLRLTYGLLNDEEIKTVVVNQLMGGGIMCATEPLDKITEDRLLEYRRILPVLPSKVMPVSLMESVRFPEMTDVYLEELDAHLLCVINWEDEQDAAVDICIQKLLPQYANAGEKYLVCDYYNGDFYMQVDAKDCLHMKPIAPHGANVYKIVRMNGKPQVVSSTGNYSMGGEFTKLEWIGNKLQYQVKNDFDVVIDYQIVLPNGQIVSLSVEKGVWEGDVAAIS